LSGVDNGHLGPYIKAARQHGAGFGALLWASPRTQRTRFETIRLMVDPAGRRILDAGCGRADYLAYLIESGVWPADYVGIEGVETLAAAARAKALPNTTIVCADFVLEPARLFVGADIVVFSGSLNTLKDEAFYATIRRAYDAAGVALVFNFLNSTYLAGQDYLFWRRSNDVFQFARQFCGDVRIKDNYLQGDCTACLTKPGPMDDCEDINA